MDDTPSCQTSPTLLGRLQRQPNDQAAWEQFVERYGRLILAWCRQARLQDADIEDISQIVLIKLADKMRTFAYDPSKSFRGWLRTLTRHAWSDFVESRQRARRGTGDSAVEERLHTLPARDDLLARPEEAFDREVLEEASARIRLRVEPSSWEAFQLTAVQGLTSAAAAARLGKEVAAVAKARRRVQKMLEEEVRKLEGDGT
jgi:RNA polymerase sigma factor (sigma-70 family)